MSKKFPSLLRLRLDRDGHVEEALIRAIVDGTVLYHVTDRFGNRYWNRVCEETTFNKRWLQPS